MQNKAQFTLLEVFFIIFIIITFYCMLLPTSYFINRSGIKVKTIMAAKSIGLIMNAYAEDDIKDFKMPYPLPEGKEKVWGNSKDCWSTSIAEMLFKQKYMRKGEESQLKSSGTKEGVYSPMYLNDNTLDKDLFWSKRTELDFHIYCEKGLTSKISGKKILVATYDNEDIRNCQFSGAGWVVFYSDRTTEFIKRAKSRDFAPDSYSKPIISVNDVEGSISGNGIVLRKNIPESEGGPGTFGNHLGGGSTELIGKKTTDAIFKALVR